MIHKKGSAAVTASFGESAGRSSRAVTIYANPRVLGLPRRVLIIKRAVSRGEAAAFTPEKVKPRGEKDIPMKIS